MMYRMIVPTKAEREAIKREYGPLFASISNALFEADPIGINFDDNTDEYDAETGTIIPRLGSAKSAEDVQAIVYQEFCRWFDPITAGRREKYASVSAKIWELWYGFRPLIPHGGTKLLSGANSTSANGNRTTDKSDG
jgi:hypothetical protein